MSNFWFSITVTFLYDKSSASAIAPYDNIVRVQSLYLITSNQLLCKNSHLLLIPTYQKPFATWKLSSYIISQKPIATQKLSSSPLIPFNSASCWALWLQTGHIPVLQHESHIGEHCCEESDVEPTIQLGLIRIGPYVLLTIFRLLFAFVSSLDSDVHSPHSSKLCKRHSRNFKIIHLIDQFMLVSSCTNLTVMLWITSPNIWHILRCSSIGHGLV